MRTVVFASSILFGVVVGCSATPTELFGSGASGSGASGTGAGTGTTGSHTTGTASTGPGASGTGAAGTGGGIALGGSVGTGGSSDCSAAAELVYVWGTDNNIYSFDPPSKTFTMVATPDCDALSPNSMAIDRNLVAWLNYLSPGFSSPNDYIYQFDLKSKMGCKASGINIPPGYTQVGMGFSSDTPGGTAETLYVDGIGGQGLARVDMTGKTIVPIGNFSNDTNLQGQSCELTGTGDARLFGYFTTSPYVRVAQLDKTNANSINDNVLANFPPPSDWAFSFWGGDFYLYAYPIPQNNSVNSSVVHYSPMTNTVDLSYVPDVGFTIIGAGVSTCAPTTPPK